MRLLTFDGSSWRTLDPRIPTDNRSPLLRAVRAIRQPTTTGAPNAHHSVYVALLHGVPGDGEFSFYVGMTGLTPEERYLRHIRGVQAGKRRIQRYGAGLLPDLYERFNPMSDSDARLIEAAIAEAVRRAGYEVHSA